MAENKSEKDKPRADKPIFSWEAPEAVHYKKNPLWYVGLGVVAVAMAGILYWLDLWSGALVVVAAALALAAISQTKPRVVKCAVYQDGVVVAGKTFEYSQFKSFWFVDGQLQKIKLNLTGTYTGEVDLPLKNVDSDQIRLYLKKRLPEEARGEDLIDRINRIIKF